MIAFRAYASGSSGNLYTVTDGETTVAIEAGLPYRQLQRALDHRVQGLAGVLISHCHGDHAQAVPHLLRAGVDCYMSRGTAEALGSRGHRVHHLTAKHLELGLGSLSVMPFDLRHDAPEPLGFVISSRHGGRLLHMSDTGYSPYRFEGLTAVAIEANFSERILRENVENGSIPRAHMLRVMASHMSIERAVDLLKANDLSRVEEIHLLHLSSGNANEADFVERVRRATGKPVYAAPERMDANAACS